MTRFLFITLVMVATLTWAGSTSVGSDPPDKSAHTVQKVDTQVVKVVTTAAPVKKMEISTMVGICGALVGLFGIGFGFWQYRKRNSDAALKKKAELKAADQHTADELRKKEKTVEERYSDVLREELGSVKMLGLPDLERIDVTLLNVFVDLRISDSYRTDRRFAEHGSMQPCDDGGDLKPGALMKRAFEHYRMLLIIGDPGSGKTTLLKYYAMCCLNPSSNCDLGLPKQTFPVYFPLRDLLPVTGEPGPLAENLCKWAKSHSLDINAKTFNEWLHRPNTLVLLDGLDEVSDLTQRKRVCEWIDNTHNGLTNARFVATSRWTGYRKTEGIELECNHLRADVKDFSPDQQEEFLRKWFHEAFCRELAPQGADTALWQKQQKEKAAKRAEVVVAFLKRKENERVRELAAVPMLLQIMAILWKEREFIPQSRTQLYDVALNYLLDYRDRRRKLDPLLPAETARRVLAPAALWMQEELHRDEVLKDDLQKKLKEGLDTLDKSPEAKEFCENLRDRAGVIADCGKDSYIFRHKSFREYMASQQISNDCRREQDRIDRLAAHFGDDWWEEPIRFFINATDQHDFDKFMAALFRSDVSKALDQRAQNLLQTVVREAPQKKLDALREALRSDATNENQKRYALDCLKTIGTPEAFVEAAILVGEEDLPSRIKSYAFEISMADIARIEGEKRTVETVKSGQPFRNIFENNAEYLPIPGGTFRYSVTGKDETVHDMSFAKYPVTNRQYRNFIDYLAGKEEELWDKLPTGEFSKIIEKVAEQDLHFKEYLQGNCDPAGLFKSDREDDKKFNNPDQPVVSVTWYDATAYCLWLSALDLASNGQQIDIERVSNRFRLPSEVEWEWAAAGRGPNNTLRKYPWPDELGEPTPELANYENNVGTTTPVGRYQKGATPEGLMDMAGNVWEWCSTIEHSGRVLRGGSWGSIQTDMRCAYRGRINPNNRYSYVGFRCVR
jgi:formylglycine-generating enzyme required for sulfatase activity